MKPIEFGHTPNGNFVILFRSSDPTSFFFSSTAGSHDGSVPVQIVETNPLKRPVVVTLEGVAPPVKRKRRSPIKKAGTKWSHQV